MQHIRHIWPTVKDLADDLAIPYTTAHSWAARGRIPADYDDDLIAAAQKRGIKLTRDELASGRKAARAGNIGDHPPANGAPPRHKQEGAA